MPRKTAAEEFTCVSCSRKAVYYVFQEGYRASGFFVCADHVDNFREGRTVEKIAARKTSSKEIS